MRFLTRGILTQLLIIRHLTSNSNSLTSLQFCKGVILALCPTAHQRVANNLLQEELFKCLTMLRQEVQVLPDGEQVAQAERDSPMPQGKQEVPIRTTQLELVLTKFKLFRRNSYK